MANWEDELLAFLKRTDVKALMHQHVVEERKKGVRFNAEGSGTATDEDEALKTVQEKVIPFLRSAVITRIPSMWRSVIFEPVKSPSVADDGSYEFSVYFRPNSVISTSLYQKNDEHLENVVAYLSHGAKAIKHSVFGPWEGHYKQGRHGRVVSRVFLPKGYKRPGDPFLVDAVKELNAILKESGVTVVLDDSYLPEGSGSRGGARKRGARRS